MNHLTRLSVPLVFGIVLAIVCGAPAQDAAAKDAPTWAEGVPYLTDYEDAIKQVRETGRMLLIYNGWKREGI